jgi:hypothetical protein
MLALTAAKSLKPYSNSEIFHNKIDFSGRKYSSIPPQKTETQNSIKTISKKIQADVEKIKPSSLKQEMDVGRDITHLDSQNLYDHARELSFGNPYFKNMGMYLLFKAVEKGNLEALNSLGILIVNRAPELNKDQVCDRSLGIEFINEAAEKGNINALMNLGWCYLRGEVVDQDINMALKYFGRADEVGNKEAHRIIKDMKGNILNDSNPKQAVNIWLSKLDSNFPRE